MIIIVNACCWGYNNYLDCCLPFPRWVLSLIKGIRFLFFYKTPFFLFLEWFVNSF